MDDDAPERYQGLMAEQAYGRMIQMLWAGELASGQFVSVPGLAEQLGLSLAATREAVKRADAQGLVNVLPKRGVIVMRAEPRVTRDCLDLRSILDQEGARRLTAGEVRLPLDQLRTSHEALIEAAQKEMTPDLPGQAITTERSLHDALSTGLDNPLALQTYRVNRDRIAIIENTRPFLQDRIVSAMEEHLDIIDALERRDSEGAVAAIRAHLRQTLRWWGVVV